MRCVCDTVKKSYELQHINKNVSDSPFLTVWVALHNGIALVMKGGDPGDPWTSAFNPLSRLIPSGEQHVYLRALQ